MKIWKFAMIAGLAAAPAMAQERLTVTFDGPVEGGWTFRSFSERIAPTGGNPGAYLHSPCNTQTLECLDAPFVVLTTQPETQSQFTGDYRARNVTAMGLDAILHYVSITAAGRPMSLVLVNYNGTPQDPSDDIYVYTKGDEIPQAGQGWRSYAFSVPSASTTLPAGWEVWTESPVQGDAAWNLVITAVDEVRFFWAHPESFAILQLWEPGADNVFIETSPACYPDCDSSTGQGVLDIFDFLCFGNRFSANDPYACDCDVSTGSGVCDIFDFLCFGNEFNAGCP